MSCVCWGGHRCASLTESFRCVVLVFPGIAAITPSKTRVTTCVRSRLRSPLLNSPDSAANTPQTR